MRATPIFPKRDSVESLSLGIKPHTVFFSGLSGDLLSWAWRHRTVFCGVIKLGVAVPPLRASLCMLHAGDG